MTSTDAGTGSTPDTIRARLTGTARTTGLLYLALAVTGAVGFQVIRGQLYVAGDPAATLSHVVDHTATARLGIVVELGIVVSQALVAVWFYRLFRSVDPFAAGLVAVFGMVNAVAVMGSAALLATAFDVADDTTLAVSGGAAATVQLLYVVSGHLWTVGGMFFGLWLIPMGWLVVRSGWMPRLLGQVLVVGGVGYVLNTFVTYVFADAGLAGDLLLVPSIVGELWMVGHLVVVGVREHDRPPRAPAGGAAT